MDYTVLPKQYSREIADNYSVFLEKEQKKLQKKIKKCEKEILAEMEDKPQFLKEHPEGNFKDYLHLVSKYKYLNTAFVFALLGAALGLILYLVGVREFDDYFSFLEDSNVFLYMITFAVVFWLVCLVARWLVGYIYGAILGFIGYPIFLSYYKHRLKAEHKRVAAVDAKGVAELKALETEFERIKEAELDRSASAMVDYEVEFDKRAWEVSQKFMTSPVVDEISSWVTAQLLYTIDTLNRASHIEELSASMQVIVFADCVVFKADSSSVYSFEEHRCQQIEAALDGAGLALAIVEAAKKKLEQQYKQDESNTPYTVTSTNISEDEEDNEGAGIRLQYTAKNGNYKPVKKW